uniref:Uncharacterized protein n=1 Tax=Elaeophora elaphi TaxID=1147741 RepID=A0A0R3RR65_9BILA
MDDNLADYRRFCANRLKRLERCKKTKSFCNLDDEIPHPFDNTGSELVLRGSENFPSHGDSITFSRRSENIPLTSVKPETVPFCLGTSTFCSGSNTPMTDTTCYRSTGVFPMNVISSIAEANLAKPSLVADSWLQNSRKYTQETTNFTQDDSGINNNSHLPPSSCLSFTTSSTTALPSQPSVLSTKKPESEMRSTVNSDNDCGDCNRNAQRNFDLLREKMVKFAIFYNIKYLLNFSISIDKTKNFE